MAELENCFHDQEHFTKRILKYKGYDLLSLSETERVHWSKEYVLAIMNELTEFLGNLNWKTHKSDKIYTNVENVYNELIDLQKYLWGLMATWGIDSKKLVEVYNNKSFVVEERFRQEQIQLGKPLLLIDLDGVVYDYPKSFLDWAKQKYPNLELLSKRKNPIMWEMVKMQYRSEGGKQTGSVVPVVDEFLVSLKKQGWFIVIFTYRPIQVFQNIEYDTYKWLHQNGIIYDKVVWANKEKAFYLMQELIDCDVFIDDDAEACWAVQTLGKKIFCRTSAAINNLNTFLDFSEVKNAI